MKHTYAHPRAGLIGRMLSVLLNSVRIARVRRAVMSRLPFLVLESDVVDVVYANWLVDTTLATALAPAGARLWDCNGRTPLTILTYKHGHFGPRAAKGLRRLMPSPLQSNWRLYLKAPLLDGPQTPTVAFVHNVMDNVAHVVGSRLFSDALPSHFPASFHYLVGADAAEVCIEPGKGSAPGIAVQFERHRDVHLPEPWRLMFKDWHEAVEKLASQEAAVVEFAAGGGKTGVAVATIHLPVSVLSVEPLEIKGESLHCPLLQSLNADAEGLHFLLARVKFLALSERQMVASDVAEIGQKRTPPIFY